jgi:hypothetical protein
MATPDTITDVTVDDVRAFVEAREAIETYDDVPVGELWEAYGEDLDRFTGDLYRTVYGEDAPVDQAASVLLREVDRLQEEEAIGEGVIAYHAEREARFERERDSALDEMMVYKRALQAIAAHPCPNRDCDCGPAPGYHSMGRIARMALGLPEPATEEIRT